MSDETLRALQRLAASGSQEAQKRYIAALERAAGVGPASSGSDAVYTHEVYEAKDKQWFRDYVFKGPRTFSAESRIYVDGVGGMLDITFQGLGHIGFTLAGFPREHWDWLLGSVTSQTNTLVDQAYKLGVQDTQATFRKALGISDKS
jgi:hypothetical protein